MKAKLIFLVGFDRCGSSMIAKLLAKHPQINLLFQPFNSTEVHKTQWEIWLPEKNAPKTEAFLNGLLAGYVDKSYIASDWFYKHSTSYEIDFRKINLIKDTKFHFKTKWLKSKYPEVDFYGIWRDPRAIVCSLLRNDFHKKWYGEVSLDMITGIIESSSYLKGYKKFLNRNIAEHERMALIVAIRTHIMMLSLKDNNWLIYEDILSNPNKELNSFTALYGLEPFDFQKLINVNYNIAGKSFKRQDLWREFFSDSEIKKLNDIFEAML